MSALRRAYVHLRNRGLVNSGSRRLSTCLSDCNNTGITQLRVQLKASEGFVSSMKFFGSSSGEMRTFSSQAGAKSNGENDDDLEGGFSDLEIPPGAIDGVTSEDESDDDGGDPSEEVIGDDIQIELESVGTKTAPRKRASSKITKVILSSPPTSKLGSDLDKWVEQGNEVTQAEAAITILDLRKRRMFGKALEFSLWLDSNNSIEPTDRTYASRLDLTAKVHGIYKAEQYIKEIPESFRGEIVYRTLLANCVMATNVKKSEEVFEKMKALGFPVSCFSCNQLLLLYKRIDKRKIADVLVMMEKENVKPSVFTYQVLIDVKGLSKDITGMEQVLERMKAEGLEPNSQTQVSLARYYAANGLKEKAEAVLKELEGEDINKNRWVCKWIMPIYASLGKEDEVERIWKVCEEEPRQIEYLSVIEAWGQLNRIQDAELAFDNMVKKVKKPSSLHFSSLLKVYANHKQLAKGKELVRRMGESGCTLGPLTWHTIVRLYIGAGEVEKADSILTKAIGQKRGRPLFDTYIAIMEKYAGRGDVHNTEKIFLMMRRAGYGTKLRQYQNLLEAYVKAGTPVYGFRDRMKADNIFPTKALMGQLAKVDAFRKKSEVTDLLE